MHSKFKRLIVGTAALAAVASGLAVAGAPAQALPAGSAPDGSVTIPATQSLSATLAMAPNPAPAICDGNGVAGYRWHAFISDTANDPATITYGGGGATAPNGFTSSLLSTSGTFVTNLNPSSTGQITPIPGFDLSLFGPTLAPGEYNIGFACSLAGETTNFWATGITVTTTSYSIGVAPAAPVLSLGAGTGTEQTINIGNPNTSLDSYNLSVVPAPANPLPTVAPGDTSFELTGLSLGTDYDVTLEAVIAGFPPVSSNLLEFQAAASFPITVTALDVFDGDDVTVNWLAPGGPAPASYDVVITDDASAVVATQTGVAGLSATFAGIPLGADYTATVTGNYASSGASSTGQATFTVSPNALIYQDITVERPTGALVLTQRCGVFGGFPAFDTSGWPGAQLTLDSVDAVGGAGVAPIVVGGPNDGLADPLFGSYPQRGSYPTLCGVNLGAGELVSAGPLAGRYYVADGSINQVTVLDTRDGDLGWTAKGDIADLFTSGPGPFDENNSFSGDFLGWYPQTTSSSAGQSVTAGTAVAPGTSGGMTSNPTLASAQSGAGLGITTLDARLALLIPVAADADNYTARLSLTVA